VFYPIHRVILIISLAISFVQEAKEGHKSHEKSFSFGMMLAYLFMGWKSFSKAFSGLSGGFRGFFPPPFPGRFPPLFSGSFSKRF